MLHHIVHKYIHNIRIDNVQQPSNYFKTMKNEANDNINGIISRNYLKKSAIFFFKSSDAFSSSFWNRWGRDFNNFWCICIWRWKHTIIFHVLNFNLKESIFSILLSGNWFLYPIGYKTLTWIIGYYILLSSTFFISRY